LKITEITNSDELVEFMTEPTQQLVELLATIDGTILVLGAGGKMGPELVQTLVRADQQSGREPRVTVVSRFRGERGCRVKQHMANLGVEVVQGDLTDSDFLAALPEAENVFFMIGFKFGSSQDPGKSIQLNCVLPAQVGMKYSDSRLVVFSSANPYPHTRPQDGGSAESDKLSPKGVYGWSIVGREMAFRAAASGHSRQKVCFYRLAYSQHLTYGVLVDLAKMIRDGEPISLGMPYVNLISQRDAIDRAVRALAICSNPPTVLNVAGPIVSVRYIVKVMAELIGKQPEIVNEEPPTALVVNDDFCVNQFGPYRDGVDDMIEAVARWVIDGGEDWNMPTKFGSVAHRY